MYSPKEVPDLAWGVVREGVLEEETWGWREISEGDEWAKSKRKAVPGEHDISKGLVCTRLWGHCGRSEAGGLCTVQELQDELRWWPDDPGIRGRFYAGRDRVTVL